MALAVASNSANFCLPLLLLSPCTSFSLDHELRWVRVFRRWTCSLTLIFFPDFITTICRLCAPQAYERNEKDMIPQFKPDHRSLIAIGLAKKSLMICVAFLDPRAFWKSSFGDIGPCCYLGLGSFCVCDVLSVTPVLELSKSDDVQCCIRASQMCA